MLVCLQEFLSDFCLLVRSNPNANADSWTALRDESCARLVMKRQRIERSERTLHVAKASGIGVRITARILVQIAASANRSDMHE